MSEQIVLSPYEEEELIWNNLANLEAWREYHFSGGGTYMIRRPVMLNVKRGENGDSHRIIDAYGIRHYIAAGWVAFKFSGEFGIGSPTKKPVEPEDVV